MASANQPNLTRKRSHTEASTPSRGKLGRQGPCDVMGHPVPIDCICNCIEEEHSYYGCFMCYNTPEKIIGEQNAKIKSLQSDFDQMKQKLQDAELEILNKMEIESELEQIISNKAETIKNIKMEFEAKFKEDRAKLEMANDDTKVKNAKIESLKSDFHQMKEKLQKAEQEISNKTETIEKVKIEFETKFKEDHAKLEMANDDIKVKNAEIESLKIDAKNQLELNAVTEKSQIEIRATLKDNLGKTTKKLVTAQNFIEEKNSELLNLKRLHEAEIEERKTKEAEIATLKINLNKLQKTEIGLKDDQKTKESDIVQLKANIDTLTKDLDLAKTTCVWEDHDSKCHVKGAVDENLKKEVENLNKKLKLRVSDNSLLQEEIKIRNGQIELRKQEIEQLNEQLNP
jgi:chromosome segregation ATPase